MRNIKLCLLVSNRFQVLFHWASRPSFHLSLAVLVHYRYGLVFSLGAWSPRIHTGVCRLSYYSGISQKLVQFRLQDFHFLWFQIPLDSTIEPLPDRSPTTLRLASEFGPTPLSLVATDGIFVNFFSFAYLDISVGQVPHSDLRRSSSLLLMRGFPHSDTTGSMLLDSSPASFVVWHVLHRLIHPRYPPIALIQLDLKTSILFTFQRAKLAMHPTWCRCGPERIRTADPYIANVVL